MTSIKKNLIKIPFKIAGFQILKDKRDYKELDLVSNSAVSKSIIQKLFSGLRVIIIICQVVTKIFKTLCKQGEMI